MPNNVIVRITSAGYSITGPFKVTDNIGNVLSSSVSEYDLTVGVAYSVDVNATAIVLQSLDECNAVLSLPIQNLSYAQIYAQPFVFNNTGTIWRHLTNPLINNKYYNKIEPYIIEYPIAYEYHDEILQNVKDYTRAFKYLPIPDGVYNDNAKIQTDNQYFNKVILYNGQQSSGVLRLVPKPVNNLRAYNAFPIYGIDSKTITYTKSDSFYQYNTFWNVYVDKTKTMFVTGCKSLSIDKVINQTAMDYGTRSFKKETLRAKGLLIRHILDDTSEAHLVSSFVVAPSQISYK